METSLGTLIAHIGADLQPLKKALADAEREMKAWQKTTKGQIEEFNQSMKKLGEGFKSVGKKMTVGLTLPIVGLGIGAFKLEKDFESAMSKITGLVGIAAYQVSIWKDDIHNMAPVLGKSAEELADALFFITSAGIKGAAAIDVLEMSAKASVSGLGETKIIADLVTSAMNAYGVSNLSAAQATDILTAAVREGKAEAPQLVAAMGQVLPIASEMKVGFDEVSATIAAMTRTGTDASTASTQLKGILSALIRPTKQAEKAFNEMGTSSSELRKTIREKGLLQALMDIRKLTNEYGEDAMARVMPNIRALSGMLDLMGANMEDNIKIFAGVKESVGASAYAYETAADTIEQKYNRALASAKSGLAAFGSTIAEAFIPTIERVGKAFRGMATWFKGLSDGSKRFIVIIAAVVAAIGPLLTILGVLMTSVIPGLLTALPAVTAFLTGPLGIAVALIAAGAAFLIFREKAKSATEQTKEFKEQFRQMSDDHSRIQPLLERYDDLTTKAEDLGGKSRLAKEEQEELKTILEQVSAAMPATVTAFDEYGNAIAIATTRSREYMEVEKQRLELIRQEAVKATEKEIKHQEQLLKIWDERRKQVMETGTYEVEAYSSYGVRISSRDATADEVLAFLQSIKEAEDALHDARQSYAELTNEAYNISQGTKDIPLPKLVFPNAEKETQKAKDLIEEYKDNIKSIDQEISQIKLGNISPFMTDEAVRDMDKQVQRLEEKKQNILDAKKILETTTITIPTPEIPDLLANGIEEAKKQINRYQDVVDNFNQEISKRQLTPRTPFMTDSQWADIQAKTKELEEERDNYVAVIKQGNEQIDKAVNETLNTGKGGGGKGISSIYVRLTQEMEKAQEMETNAMTITEVANAKKRQGAIQDNIDKLSQLVDYINEFPEELSPDFEIKLDKTNLIDFEAIDIPVGFKFDDKLTDAEKEHKAYIDGIKKANEQLQNEMKKQSMDSLDWIKYERDEALKNVQNSKEDIAEINAYYDNQEKQINLQTEAEKEAKRKQILTQIEESQLSQLAYMRNLKSQELALFADNAEAQAAVVIYWDGEIEKIREQMIGGADHITNWADGIEAVKLAMLDLNKAQESGDNDQIDIAIAKYEMFRAKLEEVTSLQTLLGNAATAFGQQALQAGVSAEEGMEEYGRTLANIAQQNIAAMIAEGIAGIISKTLMTAPGPWGLALAAAAGGAAAALFNSLVPKFAKGGIITKPTMGMMGEYPGAATNPEIIIPFDKLAKLVKTMQGSQDKFSMKNLQQVIPRYAGGGIITKPTMGIIGEYSGVSSNPEVVMPFSKLSQLIESQRNSIDAFSIKDVKATLQGTSAVPKFADGGMVYGPTMGMVGEYAGAATNPEVIAPLSDLKDHIRDVMGERSDVRVYGVLSGDTISLTNDRYMRTKNLVE